MQWTGKHDFKFEAKLPICTLQFNFSYCANRHACCKDLQHQFETARNSDELAEWLKQSNYKAGWTGCLLQIQNMQECPTLSCFKNVYDQFQNIFALCEFQLRKFSIL